MYVTQTRIVSVDFTKAVFSHSNLFDIASKAEIISRKDIVNVLAIIISNWYILISIPIIAFAVSYIYTHRIPDLYAAKCQILLKSNETYNYQQQIYRGLGFTSKYANYEEIASQMRVIKSSNLLEEVLDRVPLQVSYYIVGRLKITEVYQHMPFKVVPDERSSAAYGATFNVNIIDEEQFRLKYDQNGEKKDLTFNFGELILEDGLYLRIEKNQNLNEVSLQSLSQIEYGFDVHRTQALLSKYKSGIVIKNLPYTSIVEITLQDEIANRAVEVLDTLANLYVQNTVRNQTEINENTLNYIDRQLDEVTRIINDIESELEVYKEERAILNLTKEEETYYQRLVELEDQMRKIDLELKAIEDLTTYLLQNEDIETLLPPSIFVNYDDLQLKNQVSKLYELRAEYTLLMDEGTISNPKINSIATQIEVLKKDLLNYVDVRKNVLQNNLIDLEDEASTYENKIKRIPKTQRQILNIERRLVVNEELYSFLLSKRAETIIARAGLIPETKIIEKARSIGVIYPDKTEMNLVNLGIGIAIAIVVVVLKVFFFTKITGLGQLQSVTDIPILGSIPKMKEFSNTYQIPSTGPQNEITQAFRSLRTNLQFFAPANKSPIVLVTSLLPGEGKTFTTVNLASILAYADKKVLVIDFDLHKPRLAKALQLPNDIGVSSYLIGQSDIDPLIQKTSVPTLDVITSGPVPPNPSELIMRPELSHMMKELSGRYDYIFLDTPPISLITDGVMLMNETDVQLFVLNSKSTTKTSIDYIERLIESKNFSGAALLLNEEKLSRIKHYYSKYGYGGYGYGGYGYGYGKFYGEE